MTEIDGASDGSSGEVRVHKFGGTTLATAERVRRAADLLVEAEGDRKVAVVSAMGDVTDRLLDMLREAETGDSDYLRSVADLRDRHLDVLDDLVEGGDEGVASSIRDDFRDIEEVLRAVRLLGEAPETARDLIAGYGEIWSARLLAGCLAARGREVDWLDAREVLIVESGELGPVVDWETTREKFEAWRAASEAKYLVVTGYVASTHDGVPTTLGRDGSDYTASIVGSLMGAASVEVWTDVDGVMSADPRLVPEAESLEAVSYEEAMELAYFGASVIHPRAMSPAVEAEIPVVIRNAQNPEFPGTRIHLADPDASTVKGFASIDNMALCNLEGAGMMGVPGVASRLFGALREAGISVVMISQASSEHSICFAVPESEARQVRQVVEEAFFSEFHHGQLHRIDVTTGCCILAAVGDGMSGIPGVAGKVFGALGDAGVNIRAIAQGSSERNISVVIDREERTRALRAVHSGFYLSSQTISIGLLGPGNVGGTLLDQLADEVERLREEEMIDLRVRAIADGSTMAFDDERIDLEGWRDRLDESDRASELEAFVDHVQTDRHPHAAVIDCTAASEIAGKHADWLGGGIHVVTPNKLAASGPWEGYRDLREQRRGSRTHYLYETTVGAGLPVLQTLKDIRETGDEVRSVEGILSGTLAYLFNVYDGSEPFSALLRRAHREGYTEPDPRDDVSGRDVARKLVILGREMGLELELDDVDVESLVPEELEAASVDEFLDEIDRIDDRIEEQYRGAREAGDVLRYVGRLDEEGEASVGLERYPADHAFAHLESTDNIVQFRTRRYDDNPLVVQGPGAGPRVTAGGLFADLLRLATYLGANS